ncbi:hypothetical protein SAMN02745866_03635 [Alteromonadaceae bacterium Bs31]|nr:hypothetical protein SAMN02745866_03635 [Alteromonadaceae bacterium Bs31]
MINRYSKARLSVIALLLLVGGATFFVGVYNFAYFVGSGFDLDRLDIFATLTALYLGTFNLYVAHRVYRNSPAKTLGTA